MSNHTGCTQEHGQPHLHNPSEVPCSPAVGEGPREHITEFLENLRSSQRRCEWRLQIPALLCAVGLLAGGVSTDVVPVRVFLVSAVPLVVMLSVSPHSKAYVFVAASILVLHWLAALVVVMPVLLKLPTEAASSEAKYRHVHLVLVFGTSSPSIIWLVSGIVRRLPAVRMASVLFRSQATIEGVLIPISVANLIASIVLDFGYPLFYILEVLKILKQISHAALAGRPRLRLWLQQLMTLVPDSVTSAAGIASLLGGVPPNIVLAHAKTNFRGIPVKALTLEMMSGSEASDKAFLASRAARLGQVDAFISHSWQDGAELKLAALRKWNEGFSRSKGRDAVVWFDRCCVDQRNIAENLRALPVYIPACRELLVLAGPTYWTRLWTLVEIFIHRNAKDDERLITFLPLGDDVDLSSLSVDVSEAQCTDPEDKSRLMGVIDNVGTENFNTWVNALLRRRATALVERKSSSLSRHLSTQLSAGSGRAEAIPSPPLSDGRRRPTRSGRVAPFASAIDGRSVDASTK